MSITPQEYGARLGFALDDFQLRAMGSLHQGRSVLVAAPTGSGKTAVAEYAVACARAGGVKAFYTTPLKALSNQKYGDFAAVHGYSSVGLLTGDVAVNGEAPVVVMTTEVLRNMIYERSSSLHGLRYVVLDEVHYLQNPYRGGVWEEVIVHAPADVVLVCLSATVSNVEEFGDWLTTVRGATDVVIEESRPVSLENLYMASDRRTGRIRLVPTFVSGRPNPDAATLDAPGLRSKNTDSARAAGRGGRGSWQRHDVARGRIAAPRRVDVVEHLASAAMLPAIYFVFSRDGCDRAARSCVEAGVRLTSPEERTAARRIAEAAIEVLTDEDLSALDYGGWLSCLEAGVAPHHAGLVPPFKEAVEACFAASVVKVVFATETLSLGINMPARTVVIEKLSKFTGEHHEILTPGEYTQLTGRAGRRGLDAVGYGIVLWSPAVPFSTVSSLAAARTYELRSSFRPTYNMAVNLVRTASRAEAHQLLDLSFAQFRVDADVVRLEAELRSASGRTARAGSPEGRSALQRHIHSHARGLSRSFDAVVRLLEGRGYVRDWILTAPGERLAGIYHESDLLVSEALEAGLLDGLGPAELAAVASCLTYEERSAGRGRTAGAAPGRPPPAVRERIAGIGDLWRSLAGDEEAAGLPPTRPPDAGFAALAHRWVSGAPLAELMLGGALPAGDFVRNVKQLTDLVRQLGGVSVEPGTREAARRAARGLWRGVVAASSAVTERASDSGGTVTVPTSGTGEP